MLYKVKCFAELIQTFGQQILNQSYFLYTTGMTSCSSPAV